MIELKGKYNQAIVYTDTIEDTAKKQVLDLCNQPFLKDVKIRMMPDLHAGKGCTVGTTMTVEDKIVPNFVGVDIGCGMICAKVDVNKNDLDFNRLDQTVRRNIPSSMNIRKKAHENAKLIPFENVKAPFNEERAKLSVGTLGGGNHFIELNEGEDGSIYLVIHSGSRHLGKQISDHYQYLAGDRLVEELVQKRIAEMEQQGQHDKIDRVIKRLRRKPNVDKNLAYLEGEQMDDYLHDVNLAQRYAAVNRKTMMEVICEKMGWEIIDTFDTIHNYVDLENLILRKGAISAQDGEIVLIPMNMRDGSLICRGKGNHDWNYSGPHGAGRVMSRSQARKQVDLKDFQTAMQNVWTTSVAKETVDESPFVYKKMKDIVKHIGDTVEVLEVITPLYNFKAK